MSGGGSLASGGTIPDGAEFGLSDHPLAPYLPRLIISWLETNPDAHYQEIVGTVAFVDISGFTKLSEGLARHGKVGAEELTATIGGCFVTLLGLAYANGGRLLKFGGDALLLLFTGEAHEVRACRAAVDMRRALREVGRKTVLGQRVALRMSVGINSGLFHFFLVGESHRELLVTGPAASATVSMESTADAGEIVVSEATAAALRPTCLGEAKGPGFLLRRAPAVPDGAFMPFETVEDGLDLWPAIPVGLRDAMTRAHKEPEHRRVTVAFVHFDGIDRLIEEAGPAVAAAHLHALVTEVQRAADRQHVAFLASDIDKDGGKLILTAGAPSTAGDDEDRMLLAVREIIQVSGAIPVRIGVNRGSVFVGEVGPPYRRTFTVMGDAVNLAARLMAKALPGQVLTTPDVLSRARTGFETTELEPFFVKGKTDAVRALSVGARSGARSTGFTDALPLIGRHDEVRAIEVALGDARAGRGRLVEIVGEPGVGKSRLAAELRAMTTGVEQLSATCERYDASTPYHVVRKLLRSILGLAPDANDAATARRFLAELDARAPAVLPWAPLIAAALDLFVPETPETLELADEFRRVRLAEAVLALLASVLPECGVLTVEEVHYMDEASADLFTHLAERVGATSWLVCTTRRHGDDGFVAPNDVAVRLELQPLDEADATELARIATMEAPPTRHELEVLVRRSGGNPLFLRELIVATQGGTRVDGLPDSVEDMVAARIDRLASDDRHLLRRLAVLGQTFPLDLVSAVFDDLPASDDPTWARLDEFLDRTTPDSLQFRNALWRDVAYNGLSFRLRREIHARAGETMLAWSGKRGIDLSELLSFHFLNAQRYPEAWRYSLSAAERARAVYANIEAAEFYERALVAGRRLPDLADAEIAGVLEALGDARNRTGGYAEAASAYRAARRLAGDDVVRQGRLMLKLARVQGWLDRYPNALRWITRALRTLEHTRGADADRERAELLCWYGRFCQEGGHHERAITWCTRAVEQAEAAGATSALAEALKVIDWALMDLGRLEEPRNWWRALRLFEELGDLVNQGSLLNLLGGFAYFRGEWDDALRLYERARDTIGRTGNAVAEAFHSCNIGEVALDQGRFEEAGRLFDEAARAWRAAGYRSGSAYLKCNLGRAAAGFGDFVEAERLLSESIAESRSIGSHGDALEAQARLAECRLTAGDDVGALALADDALAQTRRLGGIPAQVPLVQRVRGAVLARRGDLGAADDALSQSLAAARARRAEYEEALTLRILIHFGLGGDAAHLEQMRATADASLLKLGVVTAPDLGDGAGEPLALK